MPRLVDVTRRAFRDIWISSRRVSSTSRAPCRDNPGLIFFFLASLRAFFSDFRPFLIPFLQSLSDSKYLMEVLRRASCRRTRRCGNLSLRQKLSEIICCLPRRIEMVFSLFLFSKFCAGSGKGCSTYFDERRKRTENLVCERRKTRNQPFSTPAKNPVSLSTGASLWTPFIH